MNLLRGIKGKPSEAKSIDKSMIKEEFHDYAASFILYIPT